MSSAVCFNMDQSKILSFWNGLKVQSERERERERDSKGEREADKQTDIQSSVLMNSRVMKDNLQS